MVTGLATNVLVYHPPTVFSSRRVDESALRRSYPARADPFHVTHVDIAQKAVAQAATIVRSHPNHPTEACDVLDATAQLSRLSWEESVRSCQQLRFFEDESFARDAIAATRKKWFFDMFQRMRHYEMLVRVYVQQAAHNLCCPATIQAESNVLKHIWETR